MAAQRSQASTKLFVGCLIAATSVLTVAGIAAMFLSVDANWRAALQVTCVASLAAVAGFALGLSYNAAAAARRVMGKPGAAPTFWVAGFCAVVCGAVSLVGVHLSWTWLAANVSPELRAHLPSVIWIDIGGLLLAIVKPAMGWVVEELEEIERAEILARELEDARRRDASAAADRAARHEEAMARINFEGRAVELTASEPAPPVAREPVRASSQRGALRRTAEAAALGLTVLAGAGAAHAAPAHVEPTSQSPARTAHRGPVTEADRAEARSMLAQGHKPGPVSRATGVPLATCKRYAKDVVQPLAQSADLIPA